MLLLEIDWGTEIIKYVAMLPVSVVIILGVGYFVFKKIFEPRWEIKNTILKTKLEKEQETELSNKEVEKYNEEAEWKKTMSDGQLKIIAASEKQTESVDNLIKTLQTLVNKEANNLSLTTLEEVITTLFSCSMYKLIEVCMYVIKNNNISNEARKKSIINSIKNTNSIDFDYSRRFLSKIYYKNNSLDTYMVSITDDHKNKFIYELIDIMFSDYESKDNLLQDLINYLKSHYQQHISECLLFVSKF